MIMSIECFHVMLAVVCAQLEKKYVYYEDGNCTVDILYLWF